MRHLQTVGARLALALLLVVAAVLAFVYLIVTPSLEDRLIGSREDQVAGISQEMADHWPPPKVTAKDLAAGYAAATHTRVRIFHVDDFSPLSLSVEEDEERAARSLLPTTIRLPGRRRSGSARSVES